MGMIEWLKTAIKREQKEKQYRDENEGRKSETTKELEKIFENFDKSEEGTIAKRLLRTTKEEVFLFDALPYCGPSSNQKYFFTQDGFQSSGLVFAPLERRHFVSENRSVSYNELVSQLNRKLKGWYDIKNEIEDIPALKTKCLELVDKIRAELDKIAESR